MVTITKISEFQPTILNSEPTSTSQFSGAAAINNFDSGFSRNIVRCRLDERGEMELVRKLSMVSYFNGGSSNTKERTVEIESSSGGDDLFYAAATAAESRAQPDHLVIMVNGIIDSAVDWRYAVGQFVKNLPDKVIVHRT